MILQFFAAFIGAAGFGFLFHLQFKHIFPAALGGVLTWVIYVIATTWGFDVFISSLFASAFAAIYSEVIAKIRKAPTTLFLIISVVVLIPGGSLYYTMSYAVQKKWAEAAQKGKNVEVDIQPYYEGDSQRPTGFIVIYKIEGKSTVEKRDILNE